MSATEWQSLLALGVEGARTQAHLHTCTHAHKHTCTHAHKHTSTLAHTHTSTLAHLHTCTLAHLHTSTLARTRARTHTHTHAHTRTHPHMHTRQFSPYFGFALNTGTRLPALFPSPPTPAIIVPVFPPRDTPLPPPTPCPTGVVGGVGAIVQVKALADSVKDGEQCTMSKRIEMHAVCSTRNLDHCKVMRATVISCVCLLLKAP